MVKMRAKTRPKIIPELVSSLLHKICSPGGRSFTNIYTCLTYWSNYHVVLLQVLHYLMQLINNIFTATVETNSRSNTSYKKEVYLMYMIKILRQKIIRSSIFKTKYCFKSVKILNGNFNSSMKI